MSTVLDVTRIDGALRVGPTAPHPARTAVLEARGALLWYDVLATLEGQSPLPSAEVWDVALASEWLWEIYGTEATSRLLDGAGSLTATTGASAPRARDLALTTWRAAWWPASHVAGIPALDPRLLTVEQALATADLEHLLDDDGALGRALGSLADAAVPSLPGDAHARLTALAEDHGLSFDVSPVRPARRDLALAAGTQDEVVGSVLASGTTRIDPARVATGSADFAGEAQWRIVRRDGSTVLDIRVPRAPVLPRSGIAPPVVARFAGLELPLEPGEGSYRAETGADPRLLPLPAAQRAAHVHTIGLESMPPLPDEDRTALIDWARARLTAPDASLAEADAGQETA